MIYYFLILPYIPLLIKISKYQLHKYQSIALSLTSYILLLMITLYGYFTGEIDHISLVLSLAAIYTSIPISLYSYDYVLLNRYSPYAHILVDLFAVSIIVTFIANTLLTLIITWTFAELFGYILISIGEKHAIEGSTRASKQYLLVLASTFEFSIFLLAIFTLAVFSMQIMRQENILTLVTPLFTPFSKLLEYHIEIPNHILTLLLIGFIAKMGIVPLHFWLPEAHSVAPAPASAILSGLSTALGSYAILRLVHTFIIDKQYLAYTLLLLGILSAVYGGLQALIQRDGKKLLAYSTIAGNGFAALAISLYIYTGSTIAQATALTAILAHMSYKTTLFLDMGVIEQALGTRYIHRIHGIASLEGIASLGSILALFSLMGIPLTVGFNAKLFTIILAINILSTYYGVLFISSVLTYIVLCLLYAIKYIRIHFGTPSLEQAALRPNITKLPQLQKYTILVAGLSSIIYGLGLMTGGSINYIYFYIVFSPFTLIVAYLLIILARRSI